MIRFIFTLIKNISLCPFGASTNPSIDCLLRKLSKNSTTPSRVARVTWPKSWGSFLSVSDVKTNPTNKKKS